MWRSVHEFNTFWFAVVNLPIVITCEKPAASLIVAVILYAPSLHACCEVTAGAKEIELLAKGAYATSSCSIVQIKSPVKLNPAPTCAAKAASNVAALNIIVWPIAINSLLGIWSAKTNISKIPGVGLGEAATIFTNWNVAPPAIPP